MTVGSGRALHSVQDYLIHLDQVVRVKPPAVDGVAIGRDETRRDQMPALRHDRAARSQKRDEIAGSCALPPNESAIVSTETDHDLAVVAHVERSETSLVDGANRLHASIGLPDPGLLVKIAVVSAHDA